MKKSRRMGQFKVTFEAAESGVIWDVLASMKFTPFRVEALLHLDCLEYVGSSYLFREVPVGECIPDYTINISRSDDSGLSVSVDEIK